MDWGVSNRDLEPGNSQTWDLVKVTPWGCISKEKGDVGLRLGERHGQTLEMSFASQIPSQPLGLHLFGLQSNPQKINFYRAPG